MQESALPQQPSATPDQEPAPATPLDQPPTQPTQPVTYTVPHHADHKVLFILLGIIALALLSSGLFALFSSSTFRSKIMPSPTVDFTSGSQVSKPASNPAETTRPFEPAPTLVATESAVEDSAFTQALLSTETWPTKETLCYSFRYAPGGSIGSDNNCSQYLAGRVSTDPDYPLSVTISTVYDSSVNPITSVEDMVAGRSFDSSYQVIQDPQNTIMVDGVLAVKVVETPPQVNIENHRYFIYLPNRYETLGVPVKGFEIMAVISKVEPEAIWQQQELDLKAMLESWQWQ